MSFTHRLHEPDRFSKHGYSDYKNEGGQTIGVRVGWVRHLSQPMSIPTSRPYEWVRETTLVGIRPDWQMRLLRCMGLTYKETIVGTGGYDTVRDLSQNYYFMLDQDRNLEGMGSFAVTKVQGIEYDCYGTWTGGRPKLIVFAETAGKENPKSVRLAVVPKSDDRALYDVAVLFTDGEHYTVVSGQIREAAHQLTTLLNAALARARELLGQRALEKRVSVSVRSQMPARTIEVRRVID